MRYPRCTIFVSLRPLAGKLYPRRRCRSRGSSSCKSTNHPDCPGAQARGLGGAPCGTRDVPFSCLYGLWRGNCIPGGDVDRGARVRVSQPTTPTALGLKLVALAARHAVPAMYHFRVFTASGGEIVSPEAMSIEGLEFV